MKYDRHLLSDLGKSFLRKETRVGSCRVNSFQIATVSPSANSRFAPARECTRSNLKVSKITKNSLGGMLLDVVCLVLHMQIFIALPPLTQPP